MCRIGGQIDEIGGQYALFWSKGLNIRGRSHISPLEDKLMKSEGMEDNFSFGGCPLHWVQEFNMEEETRR